jgi:NAD(P)-dependent dehydrogenase (short-subunit alcohol dehydrogenase family)
LIEVNSRGIVVGASSDIGLALVQNWLLQGIEIIGSYRTNSPSLENIRSKFYALEKCDFSDPRSIQDFVKMVEYLEFKWDYLVICPGTMEPLGKFESVDIEKWCEGFEVNFLATMRVIHGLLPHRAQKGCPLVLLFAGGGTNSAPLAVSAYTSAKIALIKAVELLDAEVLDVRFTILGPGWVRTKIHSETLRAVSVVPTNAAETNRRLNANDFNPMSRVVDCVDWVMKSSSDLVGGRNFSVVHDPWGTSNLELRLRKDKELFKLRRTGNN